MHYIEYTPPRAQRWGRSGSCSRSFCDMGLCFFFYFRSADPTPRARSEPRSGLDSPAAHAVAQGGVSFVFYLVSDLEYIFAPPPLAGGVAVACYSPPFFVITLLPRPAPLLVVWCCSGVRQDLVR